MCIVAVVYGLVQDIAKLYKNVYKSKTFIVLKTIHSYRYNLDTHDKLFNTKRKHMAKILLHLKENNVTKYERKSRPSHGLPIIQKHLK